MADRTIITPALKWTGTATGLAGALTVALALPWSGWGFALFLVSSLSWTAAGARMGERSLVLLSLGFTACNLVGLWRWVIAP